MFKFENIFRSSKDNRHQEKVDSETSDNIEMEGGTAENYSVLYQLVKTPCLL